MSISFFKSLVTLTIPVSGSIWKYFVALPLPIISYLTLFPGAVPSESVAIKFVTDVPIAASSSSVMGCGIIVKTGGMSFLS